MVFQHGVPQRSIHTQFTTRTPTPILDAMKARPIYDRVHACTSAAALLPRTTFFQMRVRNLSSGYEREHETRSRPPSIVHVFVSRFVFVTLYVTTHMARYVWFVEVSSLTSLSFVISLLDSQWVSSLGLPVVNLRTIYDSV